MSTNEDSTDQREPKFSFGVSELERAEAAAASPARSAQALCIADAAVIAVVNENQGFDPYNSTDSFDRNNAWSRTAKR